ncbi:MAG: DUF1566 domain-containing protein [Rhodoferax sp.]
MKKTPTLPTFGAIVPGEGGHLAGIMRGPVVNGERQPDYALIVAITPAVLLPWGEYGKEVAGACSLTDGLANTQAMLKAKCPPALHVAGIEIEGHKDYYLPARAELWAARANVPELFDKAWHWSSTQHSRLNAFVQVFEYGGSFWNRKDYEHRVRAFRRIPLYHFPA